MNTVCFLKKFPTRNILLRRPEGNQTVPTAQGKILILLRARKIDL